MTEQETAQAEGRALMAGIQTSFADLAKAGWKPEMNMGGNEFLRHTPTQAVLSFPFWVKQMKDSAERQGAERVRWEIREALGVAHPDE